MVKIEGDSITMTRGDTLLVRVVMELLEGGEPYTPTTGDSLRFAVKHRTMNRDRTDYLDETPLILKDIPISTCILKLDPEDTKSLGFGRYVYDVELTTADGYVDTFIDEAPFLLTPEVH